MFNLFLLYHVIFVLNVFLVSAQLPRQRLCGNEDCSEIISLGKTSNGYSSPSTDPQQISFKRGVLVNIYSKLAVSQGGYWGVEIEGKKGYAPASHIREIKILTQNLKSTVDTFVPFIYKNVDAQAPELSPHHTTLYEVVDGTTIYDNSIHPSSTENPVEASIVTNPSNLKHQQTQPLNSLANEELERRISSSPNIENSENETPNAPPSSATTNFSVVQLKTEEVSDRESNIQLSKLPDIPESEPFTNEKTRSNEPDESSLSNQETQKPSEAKENVLEDKDSVASLVNNPPDEFQAAQAKSDDNILEIKKPEPDQGNLDSESHPNNAEQNDIETQPNKNFVKDQDSVPPAPDEFEAAQAKLDDEEIKKLEAEQGNLGSESRPNNEEQNSRSNGIKMQPNKNFLKGQDSVTTPHKEFKAEPSAVNVFSSIANWMGDAAYDDDEEDDDSGIEVENDGDEEDEDEDDDNEDELDFDEKPNVETPPLPTEENLTLVHTENESNDKGNLSETLHSAEEKIRMVDESKNLNQNGSLNFHDVEVETTTPQVSEPNPSDFSSYESSIKATGENFEATDTQNHNSSLASDNLNYSEESVVKPIYEAQLVHPEDLPPQTTESDIPTPTKTFELPSLSNIGFPELQKREELNSNGDVPQIPQVVQDEYLTTPNLPSKSPTSETIQTNSGDGANRMIDTGNGNVDQNQLSETFAEEPFGGEVEMHKHDLGSLLSQQRVDKLSCSANPLLSECEMDNDNNNNNQSVVHYPVISYQILIVLVVTAVTVVVFLWGYMYIDNRGREGVLIGKINNIQKQFLIVQKEKELVTDKLAEIECEYNEKTSAISNEILLNMQDDLEKEKDTRATLETQIQNLEKELENSTEVGMELNRMLTQFLSSENGSETLVANVEQLQRQIIEQQDIISTYNENLSMKETENHELRLEVDINNTKVTELQSELNKMALNLLKLEEDKELLQSNYETEIETIKEKLEGKINIISKEKNTLNDQVKGLKDKYEQIQRDLELKSTEFTLLKENIKKFKKIDNSSEALKSFLDVGAIQAELLQLRKEKQLLIEQFQAENSKCNVFEINCQAALHDLQNFKEKYDEADREKVEAITKLAVLDKYFKEREAQLQRELSKQESMWVEKQGETTSTIERIKYMQEELQNYKAQNESLKQEILEQEVQMKSQISVLEKRAHENWVAARQAERKVDDAKQEAAQLRNRLTLRERTLNEEKMLNRIQSPMEQNGEIPVSPAHISNDTAVSPPLLFGARDGLTISPPLPGIPFLPPPPGVPFMPPPLGGVPLPPPAFMPPPLIPGDHRPPPLGRISSPPLNSRYSPDRGYSPYSRNSPPSSDDDYDRMPLPPLYRGYNSYNRDDRRDDGRRELHRPPPMPNSRNNKGIGHSSGSANSNESLEKLNRSNSKV